MGVSRPPDISPLSQLLRRIDGLADGAPAGDTVPTGFATVDKMLGGGLRTGDLVVLGGDVGSGKSALALGIAMRAAMRGCVVRYYTAEMTAERVYERMLAVEGRARIDDLRRGALDEVTRASVAAATLARVTSSSAPRRRSSIRARPSTASMRSYTRSAVISAV